MVVLKSATLNSRFLNSTPTGQHATPVRPSPTASGTATTGASGMAAVAAPAQSSKLKFTTTRGSVLRGTREASPVPASTDGTSGGGGGAAADKKAPVWNKGMPVKKSAKDYTDEELKAMHGISLVSRTVTDSNHNRWDDSDEDDNWEDTIDFGDGTKVVVSKAQPIVAPSKPVESKPVAAPAVQKPAAAEQVARTVTPSARPVAAASPAPAVASKPAGNPWKKPESTTAQAGSLSKVAHHDFPAVGESAPPSSFAIDASRRDRAGSFGRPDQGDRTHYQYEQNSYDRRWQQPQPATREIFNYNTGQFEQIDATKGRRPSQHESQGRARPGLLQKIAASVTKDANARRASKEGVTATSAVSSTEQATSPTAAPATAAAAPEKASIPAVPAAPVEPAAPALDPSSPEFIEMQKKLMADSRAQAILRRQQQDEEETARKERARQKAQELADKAEKEAAAEKAAKEAQVAKAKQAALAKQQAKVQAQKEAADAATTAKKREQEQHAAAATATAALPADKHETWQRGVKLPPLRRESQDARPKKPVMMGPVSSFQRAPEDVPIMGEAEAAQQRNVWGPIGPKQEQQQQQQQQQLKLQSQAQSVQQQQNKLDGQSKVFTSKPGQPDRALSASPATQSLASEPTQSTWNAFEGIASKSGRPQVSLPGSSSKDRPSTDSWKQQTAFKKQSDAVSPLPVQTQGGAREYVFDAADEVLPLERNTKQSPGGAAQTSRTSSRFFPSAAGNAIRRPETGASQDSMTGARGFVSPSMPPSFAEADLFEDSEIPALKLPAPAKQQQQTGGRPQQQAGPPPRAGLQKVLQAMRAKMKPQQAALTEREIYGKLGQGWLETQTRAMWEAMPAKGLDKPCVSIAKNGRGKAGAAQTRTTSASTTTTATTGSGRTPWALPTHLEVTSRTEATTEPIVPPRPSLALPSHSPTVSPIKQRAANTREQGRTFPTTRPDLLEAPDFNSPIRIKTNGAAQQAVRVPRKYGKRLEVTKQDKKATDVQRQPKNMSDHGQGHGFHRGFADRVRSPAKTPPTAQTATLAAPVAVPAVKLAQSNESRMGGGGPPGIHASTMGRLDGRAASFTPRQPPGF